MPLAEVGSDYFQEVDNDLLFRDVAVYRATVSSPDQMPRMLESAVRAAVSQGEWRCSPCPVTWATRN